MRKALHAAVDFYDDVYYGKRLFEKRHFEAMFDYLASLGVTHVDWIVMQMIAGFETDYPGGFDLYPTIIDLAHARDMTVFATFKPGEGGIPTVIPASFPRPEGVTILDDLRGPQVWVDDFLARNPHLRYARKPEPPEPAGPLATIKLLKANDAPTRLRKEHLSIWTSDQNNRFTRYEGDFTLTETVEWRTGFPRAYKARVLSLEGLSIPAERRYILVRSALADDGGDFTNTFPRLIELYDADGALIPSTPGQPHRKDIESDQIRFGVWRLMLPYFRAPEVQALLDDDAALREHFADCFDFDTSCIGGSVDAHVEWTLDREGVAAVARGKATHLTGRLHPAEPEARAYWLSWVDRLIDAGFDGIDFRASDHSGRSFELGEYGFNAPVIEGMDRIDRDQVSRRTGDAYTDFLAEARGKLKAAGRAINVHVIAMDLAQDARGIRVPQGRQNIDWQWERWIREIADGITIRGLFALRPAEHDFVVDRVSRIAHDAGKAVAYQSTIKETRSVLDTNSAHRLAWEMDYVRTHPRLDAYQLYETANFIRMDEHGELRIGSALADAVRDHFLTD